MTYYLPPLDLFDTMQKLLYYAYVRYYDPKNMIGQHENIAKRRDDFFV